jgi:exonuclease SbcC
MTGGRMHVRFDTQRETLAGEVREALEIHIADELGTREYSLYSGGEAFRVNFAIRIALSKLLARRAGAELQTLVIDEGFGTQDTQGRERLVEAINTVQGDFARVLVITHIDELKDAFPTRIQVTKTPDGSVVQVM